MLKDPVEFALDQALLSIKRMERRLPAITFNHDALYQAFDAAWAFNLAQRKNAARYVWLRAENCSEDEILRREDVFRQVPPELLDYCIDKEIENAIAR